MDDVTYESDIDIGGVLVIPHAVFSLIATVFVVLRLYTARIVTKSSWAIDEYVSIIALTVNHIMLICEGVAVHYGLGTKMTAIMTDKEMFPLGTTAFLQCLMSVECAYATACPLSKLAVLAMYYRIFSTSRTLRYCLWAIAAMLVGWGISSFLVSVFSCTPVKGFWDQTVPSVCIDSTKFFIGITIPNIVFDILTVALPVREVWKLQMGNKKKAAITSVFLLGGSVVLASITRLVLFFIYQPGAGASGNNISQTVVIPHTASAIETTLAIIGACLPPCAPLLKRWLGGVGTVVSRETGSGKTGGDKNSKNFNTLVTIGKMSNRGPRSREDDDIEGSFERLDDGSSLQGSTDDLYAEARLKDDRAVCRGQKIRVRHEVQIESSDDLSEQDRRNRVVNIPLREL